MKVFISHGHNEVAKLKIKDFVASRLGHEPVILGELGGRQGLTISIAETSGLGIATSRISGICTGGYQHALLSSPNSG